MAPDTAARQRRCAASLEGHDFPIDDAYGECRRCGLYVGPPGGRGGGERAAA